MSIERDQKLIEVIKEGSEKALKEVYLQNKEIFFGFAFKYINSKEDIEDIFEDTFLTFWENIIDGKLTKLTSRISTYLFGIGKYKILDHIRKNKRKNNDELNFDIVDVDAEIENLDLEQGKLSDREILLERYFDQLGEKCKKVLALFYLNGFKIGEIQIREGYKSINVVKSQKSRCLKQLKELIKNSKK